MSRGAEGTAGPQKLFSQGISGYDWSYVLTGYDWSPKTAPPGVKNHGGYIHTPQQKIYAKVRSP
jgi:hypothetical protein